MNFWDLKQSVRIKFWTIPYHLMAIVEATILKAQSSYIKFFAPIQNLSVQCLKLMVLTIPNPMNGTSFGAHLAARTIYMRASTSTKRSITSLNLMKSLAKTFSVTIMSKCSPNSERSILILSQIPMCFQMNLEIFMLIFKNWNRVNLRRTYGFISLRTLLKVKEYRLLTI